MRKIWNDWGQVIALLGVLLPLLLGLFAWMRSDIRQLGVEIGQVRTEIRADMERLEDRLDARLVRVEGHMADLSKRVAHIEGHLGLIGSPPSKAED